MTSKKIAPVPLAPTGEFLLYTTADGRIRIETRMQDETVWLNQTQMCELFGKDKRTISEHLRNIFAEGELLEAAVVRKFRTTAADGKSYQVAHYNLEKLKRKSGSWWQRESHSQRISLAIKACYATMSRN